MTFTHRIQTERYQIYAFIKEGQTQSEIAQILGRDKYTISNEINHGCSRRDYRQRQALNLSHELSQGSRNANQVDEHIVLEVRSLPDLRVEP